MPEDKMRAVIFGSSATKEHEQDYKDAYEVGKLLAANGFTVVNGGYAGIMEAVSKGAKEAGGKAIGITCKHLTYTQPNAWLHEVVETEDLFDRMKTYFQDAELFVVFPGGSGTLTEMMLTCDLMGMEMIKKKPIIAFGEYWKPVIDHVSAKANVLVKSFDDHIKIIKDIGEFKNFLENDKDTNN